MASSAKRSRFSTDDVERVREMVQLPESENEGMSSDEESILYHQLASESEETTLRCGIAEKRRTLICISLNNKRITKQYICYMPRSFKL